MKARLIYDPRVRGIAYQVVVVAAVLWIAVTLFQNTSENLAAQNISTGFDFLWREAGFVISNTVIDYKPTDTYARALLVGILNTITVSALACVIATLIGTLVGILRLSPNPLLARLMLLYVEALRNVPLLLYLFLWYAVIISLLPVVRDAIEILPHVYLSNGGLFVPSLDWGAEHSLVLAALALGCVGAAVYARAMRRRRVERGTAPPTLPVALLLIVGPAAAASAFLGPDWSLSLPELGRFRFSGGTQVSPEFVALLVGLSLSASAAVAEIVRSGIQAVDRGQWDAASSLGLSRGRTIRLVVLPLTLRIVVPPMTSTYLNVTKNSSLAIAIGYPDLVMVSNTAMNQTGQAIEGIAIFMTVYLALSLSTSLFMNWFNARVALTER